MGGGGDAEHDRRMNVIKIGITATNPIEDCFNLKSWVNKKERIQKEIGKYNGFLLSRTIKWLVIFAKDIDFNSQVVGGTLIKRYWFPVYYSSEKKSEGFSTYYLFVYLQLKRTVDRVLNNFNRGFTVECRPWVVATIQCYLRSL